MKKLGLLAIMLTSLSGSVYAADNLIHFNASKHNFTDLITNKDYKGVIVDFYATWCGPCKRLAPFIEQLAQKHPSILFVKAEQSQANSLMSTYNVKAFPTVIAFKNGSIFSRIVGFDKNSITSAITKLEA